MKQKILERFRKSLLRQKNQLLEWFEKEETPIQLPYDESGKRLKPSDLRRSIRSRIALIEDAVHRIDSKEFGQCDLCSEEVETERLELDFTTTVCLAHYSEERQRQLERDLELAARVQQTLFPRHIPAIKGIQLSVLAETARIVGGDYFDFFRYRCALHGLVMADVMGKGIPAGMLMANLQASLRILGPEYDEPHALAVRLNELFRFNLKLIRFITLFLAGIDPAGRRFHYCNAGHNPPLWWRRDSRTVEWLNPTGPAIGVVAEPQYRSEYFDYRPGDLVLLYTDGLVEARNRFGEEYGTDRLAAYTRKHSERPPALFLNGLKEEVLGFSGELQDDTTAMVLKTG